jgi:hypothetical protein
MRGRRLLALSFVAASAAAVFPACVGDDPSPTETADGGGPSGNGAPIPPTKTCNGVTVPTNDPKTGCAATSCDPCPVAEHQVATCEAGACKVDCEAGFADCDPARAGCETAIATDAANCGKCGNACGKSTSTTAVACKAGKCEFTCDASYAHCSKDDATGCDTNTNVGKNDCGACGHSCEKGDCVAGRCTPFVLGGDPAQATGLNAQYGLTVLDGTVYGTNWYGTAGVVYRIPADGSGSLTWIVGAGQQTGGQAIVNNGTGLAYFVYSNNSGSAHGPGLWTVSTTGANDTRVVPATNTYGACSAIAKSDFIDSLTFDASYLYWVHSRDAGAPCPGIVRSKPDGSEQTLFLDTKYLGNVVADGGSVYFVNKTDNSVQAAIATTLGSPLELGKVGTPTYLQTDATHVYWLDQAAKKFYRVVKSGVAQYQDLTAAITLPITPAGRFLVDDTYIYFYGPEGAAPQSFYRMKKDGSEQPLNIANLASDYTYTIAQDKTALYWGTYGSGPHSAVYKLVK